MAGDSAEEAAVFRRLFEVHAEALRRYAQRFVRSRAAAEDLVQDVFLRLWRRRSVVEIGSEIRAYLYLTTRSQALNHVKRERLEQSRQLRLYPSGIAREEPALPGEGESRVRSDEIVQAIESVLRSMPPRQREVAALRLRDQLTSKQIGARLGISPRTVEVHIARATRQLRERLPRLLEGGIAPVEAGGGEMPHADRDSLRRAEPRRS